MSNKVCLYEVGPRDGLQNEKQIIPTEKKVGLIDRLSECGFSKIEATSFVSPKWVPQLGDSADVFAQIKRKPDVTYAALTPNLKGFEGALAAQADEVAIFASASETFSQKNINCSIAQSFERFAPVLSAAREVGIKVRGYVSCVVECPYEGAVSAVAVAEVARQLYDVGCYEISLGDTIGKGTPETISPMLDEVLKMVPAEKLAGHFHDTNHRAIDNVAISLEKGLRTFDSAIGGLGGCPYAPGAKGNVSTTALNAFLVAQGWDTGIDAGCLERAEHYLKADIMAQQDQTGQ